MSINPIETRYRGYRFRSRLEARWAVFMDHLEIRWEYEPQGFVVDGRPYLPDFRLIDCGTWVEVKGREEDLDKELMLSAAVELPEARDGFPTLLMLGLIPEPPKGEIPSWSWIGLTPFWTDVDEWGNPTADAERIPGDDYWVFTPAPFSGHPLRRADTSGATPVVCGEDGWLEPSGDLETTVALSKRHLEPDAYRAARSARFEHGESG